MFNFLKRIFKKYSIDTKGAISVVFGMSLTMIIVSAGMATDLAIAYNAKARLLSALDKAALAVGSSSGDTAALTERMENFFYANYPDDVLGTPYDLTLSTDGNTIDVSVSATVETIFMKMFGKDSIEISAEAQVVRELAGIEAVLVLDTTGSMAGNNITALKAASTNFLNIMFDEVTDIEYLKIGIVPYADSVNVGRYGIGYNPDGTYYGNSFVVAPDPDEYVTPSSNIDYGTATNDWSGCVKERVGQEMTDSTTPDWEMYRYPKLCRSYNWYTHSCNYYYTPNYSCTTAEVQPLTNSQTTLQNVINNLPTSGNTYSNLGMVWGWRMISPTEPFTEGAEYDNEKWSKTVILMTDGNNVLDNTYSGEGRRGDAGVSESVTEVNNKLAQVCEDMKDEGIRVYTVTFQSNINETTKSYYRNCATSSSMYYDAPSNDDLVIVFGKIADQLSKLHISK